MQDSGTADRTREAPGCHESPHGPEPTTCFLPHPIAQENPEKDRSHVS